MYCSATLGDFISLRPVQTNMWALAGAFLTRVCLGKGVHDLCFCPGVLYRALYRATARWWRSHQLWCALLHLLCEEGEELGLGFLCSLHLLLHLSLLLHLLRLHLLQHL